jgi:hypothetical protein
LQRESRIQNRIFFNDLCLLRQAPPRRTSSAALERELRIGKKSNDNLMFSKPERSKNSSRIDGIAATVNALSRAIVSKPRQMSIYQTRGLLFL